MKPAATGRHPSEGVPPLRVLCVDDNRDAADSAADLLSLVGFEARACYDGPSALAEAEAFRPGVCLIDLHMPGMDGDEVAVRLRAACDPAPVLVAVTAMSDEQSAARIAAAGFDFHLVKPVDPHQLMCVLDALWHAWSTGRWDRVTEVISRAAEC